MNEVYNAEIIDLASSEIKNVSPYDNAYPIVLLSNGLKTRLAEAQAVAKDIYQAVIKQSPAKRWYKTIATLQQSYWKKV